MTHDIDYKDIEEKAARMWRQKDIAIASGFDPEYFSLKKSKDPKLAEALARGKARALGKLADTQFEVATNDKSVPMLIHLGKNYLDQRDNIMLMGDKNNPLKIDVSIDDILKDYYAEPNKSTESKDS